MHEDDVELVFEATQESRHTSMVRANDIARALVDRARSKAVLQQPDEDGVVPGPARLRIVVGIDHDDLTTKQRAFLHAAVFPQIAEQYAFPDGARFVAAVWKEHFRARFLGDRWVNKRIPRWDAKLGQMVLPKRATPHRERVSTEDLSVKQYSNHIDRVIDTAVAELGVVFVFNPREREDVRYRKPVRKLNAPEKHREEETT